MTITNLKEMLIHDEGVRYVAYQCSAGYWTVGIGHNLETNALSNKVVMQIFREDIDKLQDEMADVPRLAKLMLNLDTIRNIGLVNMAFQLGVNGLMGFNNMLTALERKDWLEAYNHALDSKWYKEDTPERAQRVAQVLLTGTFQSYEPQHQQKFK